jgi:hypothetical protein
MKKPTENEVNDVLNECLESADSGRSKFPGMTYEQGVQAALEWMRGDGSNPLDD